MNAYIVKIHYIENYFTIKSSLWITKKGYFLVKTLLLKTWKVWYQKLVFNAMARLVHIMEMICINFFIFFGIIYSKLDLEDASHISNLIFSNASQLAGQGR